MKEPEAISNLANSFSKLPGVGNKSSERMAYAFLRLSKEEQKEFLMAMDGAMNKVHPCPICGLYTDRDKCEVCSDENRDQQTLCVVSDIKDALAIEKMGVFGGLYHVLGGALSVSKGVGVEDLSIDSLLGRIEGGKFKEVILALNPTLEGETTALYIAKILEGKDLSITRLGVGLAMGSTLDYADSLTLSKAFEGRKKI